jgi:uncharacterized protein
MYNAILSSPSLGGDGFFYVNPLMSRGGHYVRLSSNPPSGEHKVIGRPEWHSVACCPPNVMRLRASLPNYFSTADESGVQIHQYTNMQLSVPLDGQSSPFRLNIETEYPRNGQGKIVVTESADRPWELALRAPGWCQKIVVKVNGRAVKQNLDKGYITIKQTWKTGDVVEFDFAMPPFLVEPDPRIDAVRGCLAIQRGPIVYCLEAHDQGKEVDLSDVEIDPSSKLTERWQADLLGGVMTVQMSGYQLSRSGWTENGLYRPLAAGRKGKPSRRKIKLKAVPYYAWGNRGLKSMRVWIPQAIEQ